METASKGLFFNQFELESTRRFYHSYADWRFFVVPHYCKDLIEEEKATRLHYLELARSHSNTLSRLKAFTNAANILEIYEEGVHLFHFTLKAAQKKPAEAVIVGPKKYKFPEAHPLLELYQHSKMRLSAYEKYHPANSLNKIFGLEAPAHSIFLAQFSPTQSFLALKADIPYHDSLLEQALQISAEEICSLLEQTILNRPSHGKQTQLADWSVNHNMMALRYA